MVNANPNWYSFNLNTCLTLCIQRIMTIRVELTFKLEKCLCLAYTPTLNIFLVLSDHK